MSQIPNKSLNLNEKSNFRKKAARNCLQQKRQKAKKSKKKLKDSLANRIYFELIFDTSQRFLNS